MSITELPLSPEAQRRARMIRYSIAMTVRLICLPVVLIVPDWWRLIPLVGAVVLPWVAVVIANTATVMVGGRVQRPGAMVRAT